MPPRAVPVETSAPVPASASWARAAASTPSGAINPTAVTEFWCGHNRSASASSRKTSAGRSGDGTEAESAVPTTVYSSAIAP